jgi:hypothetical protein
MQSHRLGGHLLVGTLRRCVRGGREFGARAVVVDGHFQRPGQRNNVAYGASLSGEAEEDYECAGKGEHVGVGDGADMLA